MTLRAPWVSMRDGDHPPWHWMVTLSVLLHAGGILGVWGLEQFAPRRAYSPAVVSVRLVGPLGGGPAVTQPAPTPQQPAAQPSPQSQPAPARTRIPLPVLQAERKVVSVRPSEIKAPERTPPVERPEPSTPQRSAASTQGAASSGTGPKGATPTPGGGGGGNVNAEEARYLQMLQERIEESWRAYLPQDEGVLGEVQIQISSDGRIRDFSFLKGSGKSHVDASIVSALKKVALPPPPSSLADRPLVLRFWPSGPKS